MLGIFNFRYLIIAGIITAIIGGGWFFINSQFNNMKETIKTQQEQISALTTEKITLQSSITTLETHIKQTEEETLKATAQIIRLRIADQESRARLTETLNKLNNIEYQQKIASYIHGEKQSLVIRLMDLQVKCEMENFFNVPGKCIRGNYIKFNGETK